MSSRELTEAYQRGVDALAQERPTDAITAFETALGLMPQSYEIMVQLGTAHFQNRNFYQAETCWQKAIRMAPLEEDLYYRLGSMYYSLEDYDKAIDTWELLKILNSRHLNVYLNLGLAYQKRLEMDEAFSNFTQHMQYFSGDPESKKLKTRLQKAQNTVAEMVVNAERCMRAQQMDRSREFFTAAASAYPLKPAMYRHYATVLHYCGSYVLSAHWYEQVFKSSQRDFMTLINLGVTYEKLGDTFQALWCYNTVKRLCRSKTPQRILQMVHRYLNPEDLFILDTTLARLQELVDDYEYRKAVVLANRLQDVAVSTTGGWSKLRELQKLIEFLANRRDPVKSAAENAFNLGREALQKNNPDEAHAWFDYYLELQPKGDRLEEIIFIRQKIMPGLPALTGSSNTAALIQGDTGTVMPSVEDTFNDILSPLDLEACETQPGDLLPSQAA